MNPGSSWYDQNLVKLQDDLALTYQYNASFQYVLQ